MTPNTNIMIPKIWAKQKIEELAIDEGDTEKNKQKIIDISVEYQILSKYTAFLTTDPLPVSSENSIKIIDSSLNPKFEESSPEVVHPINSICGKTRLISASITP